jgi:predicted RNase H-like nuclease (RuvC/YqgF family)
MYGERFIETALVITIAAVFGFTSASVAEQKSATKETDKTTTQKFKEEGVEVSQKIKNYTIRQRDEAVNAAKAGLADLDARIDRLERKLEKNWNKMDEAARAKARAAMTSLRKQRNEAAEWYGGMKHSSAAAWKDVKKGFSKSYDDLKASFKKAEREY